MTYWEAAEVTLVVLPTRVGGDARPLPNNAILDVAVARQARFVVRLVELLLTAVSKQLRVEVKAMVKAHRLSVRGLLSIYRNTLRLRTLTSRLREAWYQHGPFDVIYTYWNDIAAYAATACHPTEIPVAVVTRAHRFDVYEELRPDNYMALKRTYAPLIDLICPISEGTKNYMLRKYGLDEHRMKVQRLGVRMPELVAPVSQEPRVRIVSVSSCRRVKRVETIAEMVAELAALHHQVCWTHVGGGPRLRQVSDFTTSRLGHLETVTWNFVGHVSHAQVRKLLCEGQYDIIVNLSESEGVPVSLMEAMSFGIPPVATDVGGVRELVADCGELVSTSQSPREVALIVADFAKRARDAEVRQAAREFVGKHYNAEINYPKFIDLVRGL